MNRSDDPLMTLRRDETLPPAEDFGALMKTAREEWLPRWCKESWTDFNDHDPGVMILEQLVYALTSLGYRARFSVPELLADGHGRVSDEENSFHAPDKILVTHPVTVADYERLLYDRFPAIVYARIERAEATREGMPPHPFAPVRGRLRVRVAVDPAAVERPAPAEVIAVLNEHRNLGERFDEIEKIAPTWVDVSFTLEPGERGDVPEAVARLYLAAKKALLPVVPFRSPLAAPTGGSVTPPDEWHEGPSLQRGRLAEADLPGLLEWPDAQERLRAALHEAAGAAELREVRLRLAAGSGEGPAFYLPGGIVTARAPERAPPGLRRREVSFTAAPLGPAGLYAARRDPVGVRIRHLIQTGTSLAAPGYWGRPAAAVPRRVPARVGPQRVGDYVSIQHDFPPCFALGRAALSEQADTERVAQVAQLKGYLLLFEQMLANYLGQLGHLSALFSNRPQTRTVFSAPLRDVPDVVPLLKGGAAARATPRRDARADRAFWDNPENPYVQELQAIAESPAEFIRRRNALLDHLLERFDEQGFASGADPGDTPAQKEALLQDYVALSTRRAAALCPAPESGGAAGSAARRRSGLERRISLLLGSDLPEDRYFVLEPLGFLPFDTAPAQPRGAGEPVERVELAEFAPMLVHVFIGTPERPWNEAGRRKLDEAVRKHAPAQVWHRFVWLEEPEAVARFRAIFDAWEQAPGGGRPPLELAAIARPGDSAVCVRRETAAAGVFRWLREQAPVVSPPERPGS